MSGMKTGGTERISEIPDLSVGDKIVSKHRGKNTPDRTLAVEEKNKHGDYVLSGYGTTYVLSVEPQRYKPDFVILSWPSLPSGRTVNEIEIVERSADTDTGH